MRFRPGHAEEALARLGESSVPDLGALQALGLRYERGALQRAEFLSAVGEVLAYAGPEEDLSRAWQEIFQPNRPMCPKPVLRSNASRPSLDMRQESRWRKACATSWTGLGLIISLIPDRFGVELIGVQRNVALRPCAQTYSDECLLT